MTFDVGLRKKPVQFRRVERERDRLGVDIPDHGLEIRPLPSDVDRAPLGLVCALDLPHDVEDELIGRI